MVKTNYTYEKRQKELARQKKQAEKLLRKTALKAEQPREDQPLPLVDEKSLAE